MTSLYYLMFVLLLSWRLGEHLEAPVLHDVHTVVNLLHQLHQQKRLVRGAEISINDEMMGKYE